MKKLHDYLFIAAFIIMTVLMAAAAFKIYDNYVIKKEEQESEGQEMAAVMARNAESQRRVTEMEAEIAQMVDDLESLQTFINDTVMAANEVSSRKETLSVSENVVSVLSGEVLSDPVSGNVPVYGAMAVPGDYTVSGYYIVPGDYTVSGDYIVLRNGLYIDGIDVSGNVLYIDGIDVSGNGLYIDGIDVSGNGLYIDGIDVSGNVLYIDGITVSGNGTESGERGGFRGLPVSGDDAESGAVTVFSGSVLSGSGVFGNGILSNSISGNGIFWNDISGNSISDNGIFNDEVSGKSVSGNGIYGNSISENSIIYNGVSISGNEAELGDWQVSGNSVVSGNAIVPENMTVSVNASGNSYYGTWQYEPPKMSLEERRALKTSYEETLEVNNADRERIAANQYDFSQIKIACLGDSITAAANLEKEENYMQYSYPSILGELLGAGEVVNLGIGGSSIGRYWADAYVERYMQIPGDSDIIIVMGGTNDGFCVSDNEFGNLNERKPNTFCGDLNELMKGLRENYPQAVIFFATPLPNVLHDYLMSEKEYLLPQRYFADAIRTIAGEYGIETIDLYNSNILDSHDANIVAQYMPDGVHGNHAGYRIIAEHFAAGIIEYLDNCETDVQG